jgi:hypothetical protein
MTCFMYRLSEAPGLAFFKNVSLCAKRSVECPRSPASAACPRQQARLPAPAAARALPRLPPAKSADGWCGALPPAAACRCSWWRRRRTAMLLSTRRASRWPPFPSLPALAACFRFLLLALWCAAACWPRRGPCYKLKFPRAWDWGGVRQVHAKSLKDAKHGSLHLSMVNNIMRPLQEANVNVVSRRRPALSACPPHAPVARARHPAGDAPVAGPVRQIWLPGCGEARLPLGPPPFILRLQSIWGLSSP